VVLCALGASPSLFEVIEEFHDQLSVQAFDVQFLRRDASFVPAKPQQKYENVPVRLDGVGPGVALCWQIFSEEFRQVMG